MMGKCQALRGIINKPHTRDDIVSHETPDDPPKMREASFLEHFHIMICTFIITFAKGAGKMSTQPMFRLRQSCTDTYAC